MGRKCTVTRVGTSRTFRFGENSFWYRKIASQPGSAALLLQNISSSDKKSKVFSFFHPLVNNGGCELWWIKIDIFMFKDGAKLRINWRSGAEITPALLAGGREALSDISSDACGRRVYGDREIILSRFMIFVCFMCSSPRRDVDKAETTKTKMEHRSIFRSSIRWHSDRVQNG